MKLIPLKNIPGSVRAQEAMARRNCGSRSEALSSAKWRIEVAPGCHGRPSNDPPVVGWVITKSAARELERRATDMPGGTTHCRLRAQYCDWA